MVPAAPPLLSLLLTFLSSPLWRTQLLETRLQRILLQCGFKTTERAGLQALREFIVSMAQPCLCCGAAWHPSNISRKPCPCPFPCYRRCMAPLSPSSWRRPRARLVAALVAAVEPGARPAAGPDGSSVPKAASGQAAAPAGQALVPLNRKDVGQVPAAGCAAPAAEGRSRFGGFISRLRAPNRQ